MKHLHIWGLKWQTLVQHEYHSLSDVDYTPVTRRCKITCTHKHHGTQWVFFLRMELYYLSDCTLVDTAMFLHETTILFCHIVILLTYAFRITATYRIARFIIMVHSPRTIVFWIFLKLFLLQDWLLYQGYRDQSTLQFDLLLLNIYIYIYNFTLFDFFPPVLSGGFHQGLTDTNSPQVSRTFLSILAKFNNAVIWRVLILFSFFSLQVFGTIPSTSTTVGITVTLMFHSVFFFLVLWQGPSIRLSFRFLLSSFYGSP